MNRNVLDVVGLKGFLDDQLPDRQKGVHKARVALLMELTGTKPTWASHVLVDPPPVMIGDKESKKLEAAGMAHLFKPGVRVESKSTNSEQSGSAAQIRLQCAAELHQLWFGNPRADDVLYFSGDDAEWLRTVFLQHVEDPTELPSRNPLPDHDEVIRRYVVIRMMPIDVVAWLVKKNMLRKDIQSVRESNLDQLHQYFDERARRIPQIVKVLQEPWTAFPQYWGAKFNDFLIAGSSWIDHNGHFSFQTKPQRHWPDQRYFSEISRLFTGDRPLRPDVMTTGTNKFVSGDNAAPITP